MSFEIPPDSHLAQILPTPTIGGLAGLVNGLSIARYVNLAALVLLFWDHIITFDLEVERIWTLPWRIPKIMFMLNRYILNPSFIFGWVVFLIYNHSLEVCRFAWIFKSWPTRLTIVTVQLITVTRMLALYNRDHKFLRYGIYLAWILECFSLFALNFVSILKIQPFESFGIIPGCLISVTPHWISYTWVPPIIFEAITIILILYKYIPAQQKGQENRTLRILTRDSSIYFLFMIVIHTMNVVIWQTDGFVYGDAYATPSSVLTSIAVSRMMMNLRGLSSDLVEDPTMSMISLSEVDSQDCAKSGSGRRMSSLWTKRSKLTGNDDYEQSTRPEPKGGANTGNQWEDVEGSIVEETRTLDGREEVDMDVEDDRATTSSVLSCLVFAENESLGCGRPGRQSHDSDWARRLAERAKKLSIDPALV